MSSKRPDGFQAKCGFDRIRAVLGHKDEKFDRDHYYMCERGKAEFVWNGGASMYVQPLSEWPDQEEFWEMMKLLNDSTVELEELETWARCHE